LTGLDGTAEGREALRLLLLDGMMRTGPELHVEIEARMQTLGAG
jgi:hypothetical protein